jgi:hypothetical protein
VNHIFDVEHARQYGLPEAVMISNFQFWITKNRANKENAREGRTWTYNSIKAFTDLFPYLSVGQIRRTLDRLVELQVLVTGTFNERAVDRTKWYAFYDECIFLPQQNHLPNPANASVESGKSLYKTDVNTDVNTDKPPAERAVAGAGRPSASKTKPAATPPKFDPLAALVDAGVPQQQADDWMEIRKAKRLPLTLTAWEQTQAEAAKAGMSVPDAVRWCCFKGWAGFEARYMEPRGGAGNSTGANPRGLPAFEESMENAARAKAKLFGEKP